MCLGAISGFEFVSDFDIWIACFVFRNSDLIRHSTFGIRNSQRFMAPSIPSTTWTEEQVRQLVAREELGYQNIKLPYGIETGGDDRGATAEAILPPDLSGKTVLDIGSLNGFFCFEALKRGAARAV